MAPVIPKTSAGTSTPAELSRETIDVVGQFHQFYSDAWMTLLVGMTIAIALVGVVLPLLINWMQTRTFKREEAATAKRLEAALARTATELHEKARAEIESLHEKNASDISRLVSETTEKQYEVFSTRFDTLKNRQLAEVGRVHAFMAIGWAKSEEHDLSVSASLIAIRTLAKANAVTKCHQICDLVLESFPKAKWDCSSIFNDTIAALEEHNDDGKYTIFIEKLKAAMEKLISNKSASAST